MKDVKQMEKELKAKREEKSKIESNLKDIKQQYQQLKSPHEKLTVQVQALTAVIKQTGGDDSDLKLLQNRLETIQKKIDVLNEKRTAYIKQVKKLEHEIPDLQTEIRVLKLLSLEFEIWHLRQKVLNDWNPLKQSDIDKLGKLKGELIRLKRNLSIHPRIIAGIDQGTYPNKGK
jgi:chromosome segregation ATPase